MTADFQAGSHTGYELRPKDVADLLALRDLIEVAQDPQHGEHLRLAQGKADS